MSTFIVSIEDREHPGSPYWLVVANQAQVTVLEATAERKGFEAVVRHPDSFVSAIEWMEAQ